ncbi:tetratricopeptide repeat protein [Lyngbya confervoides]|uniref:Tetratricopeptide repeat protein n=1 Tax=Lyngbya confervoides BDU141951 TaxID=1574623 RepID=A0ABD4SYK0_9CYAN|nr:tetratricopeptide repeat protein [Lyngbya confervoides]MCM1981542.1 tetratricopeptide repeat protein [Lyngbya confervoides BDU141951]
MRRLTVLVLCGGLWFPGLVVSGMQPGVARAAGSGGAAVRMAQAAQLSPEEMLRQVTVRIVTADNQGSGTLLAKQGNRYLVLTNRHGVRGQTQAQVQTADGQSHRAQVRSAEFQGNPDLAVVEFSSPRTYQTVPLSSFTPREGMTLWVGGYEAESGRFQAIESSIERVLEAPLRQGYQIGYGGTVQQGMSGGPIFEQGSGELIGINGVMAYPIRGNYQDERGQQPPPEQQAQLEKLNWGIPLQRVLERVPVIVAKDYNLPAPNTSELNPVADSQNVGWVAELEKKARLFTVRIDSTSGANGSGVIVARQGNTYTVVTAAHVVCERPQEESADQPCPEHQYTLTTHDGRRVQLNPRQFQIREGIDLAVVQFESAETYPLATIANYKAQADAPVFVAGFPKVSALQDSSWQFNGGRTFEREQGVLQVSSYSLRQNSEGLASAVAQPAFGEGYELVYTSQTGGGMSGGPVLDHNGHVVGIHGLTEGETETRDGAIQLGYSLGIPSQSLVGILEQSKLARNSYQVSDQVAADLMGQEVEEFNQSILLVEKTPIRRNAKDWIELGSQYWRARQYQEAVEAFDEAIAQNPDYTYLAWYGKSLALGGQEDYGNSIEAAKRATQLNRNYVPGLDWLGSIYRVNQDFESALQAIEQAIQLRPQDANLWNNKGLILSDLERYEEARTAMDQAVRLAMRPAFLSNRGLALSSLQRYEEAIADYTQAIQLDPKATKVYYNRGIAFYNLKRHEEAIADYTQVLQIDPKYTQAYNNRGTAFGALNRYEEAIADFNQAIQIDPKLIQAYYNRGVAFYTLKRYEEAIADFNQAIQIDPKLIQAYNNRGVVYADLNRYEEAIADYNQAIQIDPKLAPAYSNRGNTFADLNRNEEAIADYTQAILINPKDASAYYNRGVVYADLNRYEEAIADYNQAIRLDPKLVPAVTTQAEVRKVWGFQKIEQ